MNILLTGETGIGKSEIIRRVLFETGIRAGGMITKFRDRETASRKLYMTDLWNETAQEAVTFIPGGSPEVHNGVFEEFGVKLITDAMKCDLAIVDELGFFESGAVKFKRAIFDLLDSPVNVLGVIKPISNGWLGEIRAREDVSIITVTLNNRDAMHDRLIRLLVSETGASGE